MYLLENIGSRLSVLHLKGNATLDTYSVRRDNTKSRFQGGTLTHESGLKHLDRLMIRDGGLGCDEISGELKISPNET
jgi:hypothetical protein